MLYILFVMAPQYLNSNHVMYYVIPCKSAFDWVYVEQWHCSKTNILTIVQLFMDGA